MSCEWAPTFQSLSLRHSSFSNPSVALPTSQLILQPFRCFTYVTVRSPTLLSLLLLNKLILQPFRHLAYVTALPLLHLRHSSFSNHSFASPTWQALHLIHLGYWWGWYSTYIVVAWIGCHVCSVYVYVVSWILPARFRYVYVGLGEWDAVAHYTSTASRDCMHARSHILTHTYTPRVHMYMCTTTASDQVQDGPP